MLYVRIELYQYTRGRNFQNVYYYCSLPYSMYHYRLNMMCLFVCSFALAVKVKITDVELPPTLQQRLERTTAYKTKIEEQ